MIIFDYLIFCFDLESGKHAPNVDLLNENGTVSRKPSFATIHDDFNLRSSSSRPSLSAELVEAVMLDGQYRYTSDHANEVAMWCGLVSFLAMGIGLVVVGLFMALTH